MHWAYELAEKLSSQKKSKSEVIVVAAGTSPSGTIHIGNFRDVVTAYFIVKALKAKGEEARLLFSWDDFDRLRKVPKNIPIEQQKFYEDQIGRPYSKIPSPFNSDISYAEYFEKEYEKSLESMGIIPDIIRYQTEEYQKGRYATATIEAMKRRKEIYDILSLHRTQVATDEERESYYPISVYCECCGKDSTTIDSFDDNSKINYHCNECGFDGNVDINIQNNYKLPWKVDWPMRWKQEKVKCEPGGTDHAAEHGSYAVAKNVSREIYDYDAPEFVPYAFIGLKGLTAKMSGSSGLSISLGELLKVYTPEMILWMYAKRQLKDEFKIDLGRDVPRVYKEFDKFKKRFYENPEDISEHDREIMSLISDDSEYDSELIPFDILVTVYGASNRNLEVMAKMLKNMGLKVSNSNQLKERLRRVIHWAEKYSPESIINVNEESNKEYFEKMDINRRKGIVEFATRLRDDMAGDDIMQMIYDIPKTSTDEPRTPELKAKQRAVFKDLYNLLISSDKGPALSTLIKAVGVEKVKELINPLTVNRNYSDGIDVEDGDR